MLRDGIEMRPGEKLAPQIARDWLGRWPQASGGSATLINLSENHTFRVDTAAGVRFILRVHRPGYQSAASIESELEWLDALRRDTSLGVPRPLPGRDGLCLQVLETRAGAPLHAVLFVFEPGSEPVPTDDLRQVFSRLGGIAASAHEHATRFRPSAGFTRQVWTTASILDPDGLWGDWRCAPHVEGEVAATLAALDLRLRTDLAAYGRSPDRFGLIHADMRLANLLVEGERITLIDFDDCGFCWFMYDFAAAVSFFEDSPEIPALKAAWLRGYASVRPLTPDDMAIIDVMVLLRRMALLAWIGSHGETVLARAHAAGFAETTAALARPFLEGMPPRPVP